jgi:hypothetical protein
MAKKPLETGKDTIIIRIIPKADEDGDWIHETFITCNTSANLPDDAYEHYLNLARAMVGLSYIASDELIDLYTTFFDKAVDGKITGKEGEILWKSLIDFELEEPVVERKGNVVHVDFTKEE